MSFQNLPDHLLQHIYEYDNTYHEIYKKCVNDILFSLSKSIAKYYFKNYLDLNIQYEKNKIRVHIYNCWHTFYFYEMIRNSEKYIVVHLFNEMSDTFGTDFLAYSSIS